MKKNQGITLIALVITVIVLLILAGISIAMLTGNNGILSKTITAKESTIQAQYEEELNLVIAAMRTDAIYKNEKFDMQYVIEKLPEYLEKDGKKDYTWEIENKTVEEPEGEYKNYEFYIDKNYIAHIREEIKGIRIKYELEPKGYTNEAITLTINATSTNGNITDIQCLNSEVTKKDNTTYVVTKNGSYEFVVVDDTGERKTKIIDIKKIDKVEPLNFTISEEITDDNKVKIIAEVEDGEENEDSVKSGIEKYEYYINGMKYESLEANYILDNQDRYEVYVIAYDRAGNSKRSTNTLNIGRIYFVDNKASASGEDGTILKPYTDIQNAINAAQNGDTIKILAGDYVLVPEIVVPNGEYSVSVALHDGGKELIICGENENTILHYDASNTNDWFRRPAIKLSSNSILRNLVFEFSPKDRNGFQGDANNGIFYDCRGRIENVFFRTTGTNISSYFYGGTDSFKIENCTFFHDYGEVSSGYGGRGVFHNVATNVAPQTQSVGSTNVITEQFGDSSMTIKELIEASEKNTRFKENQAGVYYGVNAWK